MTKLQVNILSFILLPIVALLAYLLLDSIMEPVRKQKEVTRLENRKIEKLEKIREVQKAYYNEKGDYCDSWEKLNKWVKNGQITITQKKEKMLSRNKIKVTVDTLKTVNPRDSLFPASKYPEYNIDVLAEIPGSDKHFKLYANEIKKGNIQEAKVDVLEVKDREPVSKYSKRKGLIGKPLKLGSRSEVTLNGNWR